MFLLSYNEFIVFGIIILSFYSDIISNHRTFSFIFIMSVLRYRLVIFIDKTFRVSRLHIIRGFVIQFFVSNNWHVCCGIAILSYNNNSNNNNNNNNIIIIIILLYKEKNIFRNGVPVCFGSTKPLLLSII